MNKSLMDGVVAGLRCQDSSLATAVLNRIFADGDQGELLIALREMTQAFGGISKVAEQARLSPRQLNHMLSHNGNPSLSSLLAILKAMGMQLRVKYN